MLVVYALLYPGLQYVGHEIYLIITKQRVKTIYTAKMKSAIYSLAVKRRTVSVTTKMDSES